MNLYGDLIKTNKKESARQVLFESKALSRNKAAHYMTFLSLLTMHSSLIRSLKNESDTAVKSAKFFVPAELKGLIYRLIF